MYTSPEDDRSDLLLAGAVFVFGPVVVSLVLATVPLQRIPGAPAFLDLAVPLVATVVVPFLLLRYRRQPWGMLGFDAAVGKGLVAGLVAALPIVVAGVVAAALRGQPPTAALPLADGLSAGVLVRLVTWLGVAVLAVYVTVKARDAFRADFRTLPEAVVEIARVLAAVVVVASLLRLVITGGDLLSVILPLGVAGTVGLVHRNVRGPSSTSRATLLTPTVLLAVGSFFISFSAARLIDGVWAGAMAAAVGLTIGVLNESRGSAWTAIGLVAAIALLTPLPVPLRLA